MKKNNSHLINCPSCAEKIDSNDVFCPRCGVKLSSPNLAVKHSETEVTNSSSKRTESIESNLFIKPRMLVALLVCLITGLIFQLNFFLIIAAEVGILVVLLLTLNNALVRFNLISSQFNLRATIKNGLKGKLYLLGIISMEILFVYLSVITSVAYQREMFQKKIQELIKSNNKENLVTVYNKEVKEKETEYLLYIISITMESQNKLLIDQITANFSSFPDNIQDSIVEIFLKNKQMIYTNGFLVESLINSNFNLNKSEIKAEITHDKKALMWEVNSSMKESVSNQLQPQITSPQILKTNNIISSFYNYFNPPNKYQWEEIQAKLSILDSLLNYLSSISASSPSKPDNYVPSDFEEPFHLYGYSLPYEDSRYLILESNNMVYYVVSGKIKDPDIIFDSYVSITGGTQQIRTSNGGVYDARLCEYISPEEYNNAKTSFLEEQNKAINQHNQEMNNYYQELAKYNNYLRQKPIIERKIDEKLTAIKNAINSIKGS